MRILRAAVMAGGWAVMAWATLGQMAGCANLPATSTSASRSDIVTASDETEQRKRARLRLELATTYYSQGKYTTALDELKQAVAIDPTLPSLHEMRGLIYAAMGDRARAEGSFKDGLAIDPNNGSILHNYAWFLCQEGRYAAADALFERAANLPQTIQTSKTLLARGVCQINAGLYPEAEKTLAKSYEIDPSNPATAYNYAYVLYRRGELERARFYIGRVNSVPAQVSAESLWLAARIEQRAGKTAARDKLIAQLRDQFAGSRQASLAEMGQFDE